MDILDILKNMDKETLEKGLKEATAFLSTPQGANAAQMLKDGKLPQGENIPDNIKDVLSNLSNNSEAQGILGELKKKGITGI